MHNAAAWMRPRRQRFMETIFSQIGPWLFLLSLGSGWGFRWAFRRDRGSGHRRRRPGRLRVLHNLGGYGHGQFPQQEPGRADARRAGGPPFLEHLESGSARVNQSAAKHDTDGLSDATLDTLLTVLQHQTAMFALQRESQRQASFGQGRCRRRAGRRCSRGPSPLPPACSARSSSI